MKGLLLFAILFTVKLCMAQDTLLHLKSNKAITGFLKEHLSNTYDYNSLFNKNDKSAIIFKQDIDGNGLTDLIIEAEEEPHHRFVLNLGNNVFKELLFEEKQDFFNTAVLDTIIIKDKQPLIIYRTPIYTRDLEFIPDKSAIISASSKFHDSILFQKNDTLTIRYGMVLQFNSKPKNSLKIKHMALTLESCYWYCPQYKVSINSDGTATYENFLLEEEILTTVALNDFDLYLFNYLVNYLNVSQLNAIPSILINDGQAITIDIVMEDGKKISLKNYTGQIQQQEYYPLYLKLTEIRDRLLQKQQLAVPNHHDIYYDRDSF